MANPTGFPGGNPGSTQTAGARLDRPPPSPALGRERIAGTGPRLEGLAPPVSLGGDQPQANRDVLQGMMQTLEEIDRKLSMVAKAAPTLAPQIDRITDQIRVVSGELLTEGIVATDETATGPAFAGGGFTAHGNK